MKFDPCGTLLFFGDSITDCGRDQSAPDSLGGGYVNYINARLGFEFPSAGRRVLNRGIAGNRVYDLRARLEKDVIACKPGIVSILVGINDTWRRYDGGTPSPVADFRAAYTGILEGISTRLPSPPRLILMEPFLLPVQDGQTQWREDLDPKIAVVRELAVRFNAGLLPLDGCFAAAATRAPRAYWLRDGVHPTPAGHALIADAWLATVTGN
jgi:lysophospholipase L1-like esterase